MHFASPSRCAHVRARYREYVRGDDPDYHHDEHEPCDIHNGDHVREDGDGHEAHDGDDHEFARVHRDRGVKCEHEDDHEEQDQPDVQIPEEPDGCVCEYGDIKMGGYENGHVVYTHGYGVGTDGSKPRFQYQSAEIQSPYRCVWRSPQLAKTP